MPFYCKGDVSIHIECCCSAWFPLNLVVNDNQAYISSQTLGTTDHPQGPGCKLSSSKEVTATGSPAEPSTVQLNFRVEMFAMSVSPALRVSRRL